MNTNIAGTHSGEFHLDDIAAWIVLRGTGLFTELVRSRDPKALAECQIIFDVGGVYEQLQLKFDHHQRGGAGARANGVPYAASGLIWKHYGKQYLKAIFGDLPVSIDDLWAKVDEEIIQGIDVLDIGAVAGTRVPLTANAETSVPLTTLSGVVAALNPLDLIETVNAATQNEKFFEAVSVVEPIFKRLVVQQLSKLLAAKVVKESDKGEPFMFLDTACNFEQAIQAPEYAHVLYVGFQGSDGSFYLQAIPPALGSFAQRKPLPEKWAGLRGDALTAVTGVEGCVFCHIARFLCIATTKEGMLKLKELALAS
jgi:uncharacterized UPF0160 family protein